MRDRRLLSTHYRLRWMRTLEKIDTGTSITRETALEVPTHSGVPYWLRFGPLKIGQGMVDSKDPYKAKTAYTYAIHSSVRV